MRCVLRAAVLVSMLSAALFAQAETSVLVTGNVQQALTLTSAELAKMPRATVATTNSGVVTTYEGVLLSEILKKAAPQSGTDVAGYVVASASDGYRVVFSLGELDPTVTENLYLLADKANGNPLGAFRLVVPKDIRAVRSVRQLTKIEVVVLPPGK